MSSKDLSLNINLEFSNKQKFLLSYLMRNSCFLRKSLLSILINDLHQTQLLLGLNLSPEADIPIEIYGKETYCTTGAHKGDLVLSSYPSNFAVVRYACNTLEPS
jgi:hypothetical protein